MNGVVGYAGLALLAAALLVVCAVAVSLLRPESAVTRSAWTSPLRDVLPDLQILAHDGGTLGEAYAILATHPRRAEFAAALDVLREAEAEGNHLVTLTTIVDAFEDGIGEAEQRMRVLG